MTITHTDPLVTREGVRLYVRPAHGDDEAALATFFSRVTPEDLRFRFLTGVREVGHDRLVAMANANDDRTESLVALDGKGDVIATAMLVGDETGERAEAAIVVRGDRKGQGIGWTLLDYLLCHARRRGYAAVESIEDRANHDAIELECQMGFEVLPIPGETALVRIRRALR